MKRPVLRSIPIFALVAVMLTILILLFSSSWSSFGLWWTPIDGEIVKLTRRPRTGNCDLAIRTRDHKSELYLLAAGICREQPGARIHKQPWSLDVTTATGTAYRQSAPVFLGLLGALWVGSMIGGVLFVVVVLPLRDIWRRRRARKSASLPS